MASARSPSQVTDAKVVSAGTIAIVRRYGVATQGTTGVSVVGGPFGGRVRFVTSDLADEQLMIFSNRAYQTNESGSLLVSLGNVLGQQVVRRLAYPGGSGAGAVWLGGESFLVLGNPTVLIDGSSEPTEVPLPLTNPHGGVRLANGRVLIGGGDVELIDLDLNSQSVRSIGSLNLRGSTVHVARDVLTENRFYVFAHVADEGESRGAVVAVRLAKDTESTIATQE
jgi:hypothetical protein